MEIKSNSEKFKLISSENVVVDFGILKKGTSEVFEVDFLGGNYITSNRSCGCVSPEIFALNGGFRAVIKFTPKVNGQVSQHINIFYTDETAERLKLRIDLKSISN